MSTTNIQYKNVNSGIGVYINNRRIGTIIIQTEGIRYFPYTSQTKSYNPKRAGKPFSTIDACKKSLDVDL